MESLGRIASRGSSFHDQPFNDHRPYGSCAAKTGPPSSFYPWNYPLMGSDLRRRWLNFVNRPRAATPQLQKQTQTFNVLAQGRVARGRIRLRTSYPRHDGNERE